MSEAMAELFGKVTGNQGQVLPGVTITLTYVETNASRTVTSDEAGRYRFNALPPTEYTLKAKAEGLKPTEITDIIITVGQSAELDFTMEPAVSE